VFSESISVSKSSPPSLASSKDEGCLNAGCCEHCRCMPAVSSAATAIPALAVEASPDGDVELGF
jgi:hypothetical protein